MTPLGHNRWCDLSTLCCDGTVSIISFFIYSSLHMAVIHNQAEVLKSMLNICKATNTMAAIHQLNAKRQVQIDY